MAANTNLFSDKETNNWFKASIALNVTKQGLTNFLYTELQNLHALVGKSCGNCNVEKLIPCPTNPYCNKKKRNVCPFHQSQIPQACTTCDNVKQNIITQHRYGGPSWRNTRAEKWALDYWEVGKCYLPPDGYSSVSSVQESDFNGVISIMLNCLHFQKCLSLSCLSPPPPDKQCLLEKVRKIGRDLRHTSECKVTDADLQDYFQTLSTLLADPNCLQHDPSAMIACARLSDLQNDRMSIEEMGNLLKEAKQTLEQAKEAGQRFSEEAERKLEKILAYKTYIGEENIKSMTQLGEERIEGKTKHGEQRIDSKTQDVEQNLESKTQHGEQRIESKTHDAEHFLESKTQNVEQRIESKTHNAEQRIESKTHYGEQRIEGKTLHGEQHIESKTHDAKECLEIKTQYGEQRIESKIHDAKQCLESMTQHGEQRIEIKTHNAEQFLEIKTQHGEQRIEGKTQLAEQCIESKTRDAKQCLDIKIQDGTQRIEYNVQDGIMRLKQAQVDNERGKEDLLRRLLEYYNDNLSNVPLSVLDQSLDKRISDIYATPKIHRIEIAKDGKRVKKEQVLTYEKLFSNEDKSNRRIYIQGEPGSGKSTFVAKLVDDWCDGNQSSAAAPTENAAFDDVLIIRNFKYIFFISLRESSGQTDVMHMIKKQLIDAMYSEHKRDVMYILLQQIMETERCLVVRDGLDEWLCPNGSNQAEPSMAGFPNDNCTVLTTSRPYKLADERIKNSKIDILLEIEGINDPYRFSERILRCILDESKDITATAIKFNSFIYASELSSLSYYPMLYTLVILTWVETIEEKEHLKGSSLCALYTTLLESLCKKANDTTGFFNDLNPPQVKCFSSTSYLRPIIQKVDVISKAAFHLLFSPEKEKSIVFNDHELSNYLSQSENEFALKAGLISKRKTKQGFNALISFIHKSMQEFLAAYYIALNAHLIDELISGYLNGHEDAYLDISHVFIFLCGLNITAANIMSGMMNEQHAKMMDKYCDTKYIDTRQILKFQNIILAGYREAVLNKQNGIHLRLSHFKISENNFRDVYKIWTDNACNVTALELDADFETEPAMHISPAQSGPTSTFEFDLSTCHKLKSLSLLGIGMRFKGFASTCLSALPLWNVLKSEDPVKCADFPPVLPCMEHIVLCHVICSSTWLRSLCSTLLTLDHVVECRLTACTITPCIEDACRWSHTTDGHITVFKNTFQMLDFTSDGPGVWETLHGLNIKNLFIINRIGRKSMKYVESISQSLSSLTHLEMIKIEENGKNPGLWTALHGLNIKNLHLEILPGGCIMNHTDLMSQSLSSLKYLETLSIVINGKCPGLIKAMNGLNIKSLCLCGVFGSWSVNHAESMLQLLSSLPHLERLSVCMIWDITGLRDYQHVLYIKRVSHNGSFGGADMNDAELMSPSLSSLSCMETMLIESLTLFDCLQTIPESIVENPCLCAAIYGFNIKSLHMEMQSIVMHDQCQGLIKAMRGLNIKSLSLSGSFGGADMNDAELLSQSLSSLTHLETLSIEVNDDSPCLWQALHGLNIKSLNLSGPYRGLNVNHAESMWQSLASLNKLEMLSMNVLTYIDIQLHQSLKFFNIYCDALLPSELRALLDTLSACTRTVDVKLEFGCASCSGLTLKRIPPEEYFAMKQELETPKNITVKGFQILDRIRNNTIFYYDAAHTWSTRANSFEHADNQDGENAEDDVYKRFLSRIHNGVINRISMRLLIIPA